MRAGLLIPLLLGSLSGCTLYFVDEGDPVDPGDSPDPDPDPFPYPDPVPPDPPTPSQRAKALLAEWSGCLSLESFTSAEMAPTWSKLLSDGGQCTMCHTQTTRDFPVSSNAATFFKMVSEHSMSMLLFFGVDLTTYPGKVTNDPRAFQAVGSGTPPHAAHPRFTVGSAPLTALAKLYDATAARKAAGACDPPRLID